MFAGVHYQLEDGIEVVLHIDVSDTQDLVPLVLQPGSSFFVIDDLVIVSLPVHFEHEVARSAQKVHHERTNRNLSPELVATQPPIT